MTTPAIGGPIHLRNPMKTSRLAAALLFSARAWATPFEEVPDPRPAHHVVDLTGTLTADDIHSIDESAERASEGGELLIVVVPSTDGAPSRQWATSLFNRLRIDSQARNRGVVLMAALSDRRSEIVLGEAYRSTTTSRTDAITRDTLVAQFRAGNPRRAVVDGARDIADRVILGPAPTEAGSPTNSSRPAAFESPHVREDNGWIYAGAFTGLGAAVIGLVRTWRRRRPRSCERCKRPLIKLNEQADDAHLQGGERLEEKLGSVDYDVWHCLGCGFVEKCRYGAWFTSYSSCPGCLVRTRRSSTQTLQEATTYDTGLVEVTHSCENCGAVEKSTRVTPQFLDNSSSSRGFSSGGGGGGGGGGSSSGSGSSGSW